MTSWSIVKKKKKKYRLLRLTFVLLFFFLLFSIGETEICYRSMDETMGGVWARTHATIRYIIFFFRLRNAKRGHGLFFFFYVKILLRIVRFIEKGKKIWGKMISSNIFSHVCPRLVTFFFFFFFEKNLNANPLWKPERHLPASMTPRVLSLACTKKKKKKKTRDEICMTRRNRNMVDKWWYYNTIYECTHEYIYI